LVKTVWQYDCRYKCHHHYNRGKHRHWYRFLFVGLPDNAVKESQQRIEAALRNNGYKIPKKKITINMAPADLRKEGSAYDLTLAIGILAASEQIEAVNVGDYIIMGELFIRR